MKIGPKEARVREQRLRHHQQMLDDGCPEELLREHKVPAAPVVSEPRPTHQEQTMTAKRIPAEPTEPIPAAAEQEPSVRKQKKTSKAKARSPVKGKTAAAKTEEGAKSKLDLIGDLLKRKDGCTTADVLAVTGWPTVSMPQQAKALGLKLKKEKDGKVSRYRAAPP